MAAQASTAEAAPATAAKSPELLPTPEAFAFPYAPGPYPIQLALMQHLYATLEQAKVGIVQSPTGTVRPLASLDCVWSERVEDDGLAVTRWANGRA